MPSLGPVVPVAALAALALIASPFPAWAQPAPESWPTRPVTMVVTFAPGTAGDVLGRILSPRLGELLGRQLACPADANRLARCVADGLGHPAGLLLERSGLQAGGKAHFHRDCVHLLLIGHAHFIFLARAETALLRPDGDVRRRGRSDQQCGDQD